ncbi:DUF6277 family protein [Paraburkholderia sp.]|uniref:DUF6277 family protein n=1 Tax=Paraburkholderia sp. TaxID=1926495 RepID=UPI003D6E5782
MIDLNEILAACMVAHRCGEDVSAAMAAPFMSAVASMSIAPSFNASNVIGGMQDVISQMLHHMTHLRSTIDQQVLAHQNKQRRQKPYDFQSDMSDLRLTDAQEFSNELASEFLAPFMNRK